MSDFNSHSNVWGCRDTDQKGRIIEDVINRNNLLLYNNKSFTYLHPGTGTYTTIDLTLVDAPFFFLIIVGKSTMTHVEVITFQSF